MNNGFLTFDGRRLMLDLEAFVRSDDQEPAAATALVRRYVDLVRRDRVRLHGRRGVADAAVTLLEAGLAAEAVAALRVAMDKRGASFAPAAELDVLDARLAAIGASHP